ncbi:MAG: RagB/SusD family nutrient uptake outer membrane protein [Bacteroides sp.]|nr:RagB/SusD family nutrient uptake outer membrane protein [Bacteroides sp.]
MKLKKYFLSLSVALCALVVCSSCTDWLEEQPNDKQSEEQQFSTKNGFYAAVNGIYDRMSGTSLYGYYLSYEMIDVLGQRYEVNKTDEGSYYKYLRALAEWDYSNETVMAALSAIWGEAYQTIMNINVVLQNIEKNSAVLPDKEYQMLKGEMLACRAMIHFDMLRLFGPIYSKNPEGRGIPYNESTKTSILPILDAQTVLNDYILRDLSDAQDLLLQSDPVLTEGPRVEWDDVNMDNSQRYRQLRLNYYATTLLMARAYLWGGDYSNAATEARKITDDEKVKEFFPHVDAGTLLANNSDPDRMFSTECLFGYYNKDRGLIYEGSFDGTTAGKSLLAPRSGYINSLLFSNETQDYRYMSQYTNGATIEGESTMYLTKFKEIKDQGRDDVLTDSEDEEALLQASKFHGTFCSLMKVSEAYYILAEALGTPESPVYNEPDAWTYLNYMYEKRGIGAKSGNATQLADYITKEYIREFIGEGQIFFYFKRLNKGFDNDYNGYKEVKVMIQEPFLWFPAVYDYKDNATDEEKEARFVAPLPSSELDNR